MTDEERQLIQGLADRIRNAPAPQVDRDADNLIRQSIGSRPDALYILTQTVLIQEMALNQAKAQIEQLKAQPAQPPASFLGNRPAPAPAPAAVPESQPSQNQGRAWGGDTRVQQASGYQASNYRTGYQPPPLPPQYVSEPEPQPSGGRFSGFLHNAAQTAAGVVAGEVAFSALSSIFGHHGGGGGFFGGGGGGYYGSPISPGSETIINNYYEGGDRERGDLGGGFGNDRGSDRDLEASGLSPDLEDRRFADASDSASNDSADRDENVTDDNQTDDNQDDDSGNDDNSDSFDDGSSYDDGSGSNDV